MHAQVVPNLHDVDDGDEDDDDDAADDDDDDDDVSLEDVSWGGHEVADSST